MNYKGLPAVENHVQCVRVQMQNNVTLYYMKVSFLLFQSKLYTAL